MFLLHLFPRDVDSSFVSYNFICVLFFSMMEKTFIFTLDDLVVIYLISHFVYHEIHDHDR